jgi:hypothetical protein
MSVHEDQGGVNESLVKVLGEKEIILLYYVSLWLLGFAGVFIFDGHFLSLFVPA